MSDLAPLPLSERAGFWLRVLAYFIDASSIGFVLGLTLPDESEVGPKWAGYLDLLGIFLLLAYILLLEWWFGRTLGKSLLGVRVQALSGGSITFVQAAKRLLIRSLPVLVWILLFTLPVPRAYMVAHLWGALLFCGAVALALAVNFVITTRRRDLPWHDRWAGTEVVLGR